MEGLGRQVANCDLNRNLQQEGRYDEKVLRAGVTDSFQELAGKSYFFSLR